MGGWGGVGFLHSLPSASIGPPHRPARPGISAFFHLQLHFAVVLLSIMRAMPHVHIDVSPATDLPHADVVRPVVVLVGGMGVAATLG